MQEVSLLKQLTLAVMRGQIRASRDTHRPGWHLAPSVGLLNDPNGFIYHAGYYHLFYQWNPLDCRHGSKYWGHWRSADLIHWEHQPVALVPSEEYESHGCYSGSAVIADDRITLIYTGNVKYPDGSRTAFQCLAQENERGEYDKLGPVLPLPAGYTGHVRDPKVWQHDGQWYMVLGAQDKQLQGKVLLLRSNDLREWHHLGEIAGSGLGGLGPFGYMWECPDMFRLADQDMLIFCPQGIAAEAERYRNTFQAGYLLGQLDYTKAAFDHQAFHELDAGFEFYAPQTTLAADGRRLLFAWMGIPDEDELYQPTVAYGWIHTMTCPRELSLIDGKVIQRPARELQVLRREHRQWQGRAQEAPALSIRSAEMIVDVSAPFILGLGDEMMLVWDGERITLSRRNLRTGLQEFRYWRGQLQQLQLLCDSCSIEIFINQGEAVMTTCYFPTEDPIAIFNGNAELRLQHWLLPSPMLE
ncbi:glycoside hydrolase family 32 protein [Yersinia intermedia]|uniref:glycoside hydrolase family 32 protein n=1 Tax=Yersinia intermedia TaxID=631 RepID=UPI000B6A11F3|nr:sucrose-6-phosphate hydrolase [Yersinia intermedia]MCW8110554.1 sucrose-6-phosphate hydrolase [Yersinia intermedia]MDA5516150.1 sucrose-6-phosphate hydrolase [Yersinia intermedia]OWF87713.1 glycosyl hydrolase family 32 [Yersinia intermedia]